MKHLFTLPGSSEISRALTRWKSKSVPAWYVCLGLLVCVALFQRVDAATLPPNFAETRLATGLDPTGIEFAPDGRLFVTEKSGRVRIIKNGTLLPTPFLTLSVNNDNERGLQSIVFDPNFASNPYVYVYYSVSTSPVHNRVSRFTANGDVAVAGSEVVLLELDNLGAGNHNGGAMLFSGGKLFIMTGENAVPAYAQSMSNLLGKVLRINPDGSIPTDNPFYTTATGNNRAIWALGLRNPFRAAIQPGTGRIFINDVGQGSAEEVNECLPGKNYGWPGIEGFRTNQTPPANYQDPVFAYNHSQGCSITGGTFYNPPVNQFPGNFVGKYFYADYCSGYLRTVDVASGNVVASFATGINRPIDVKVGPDGSLYYLARGGIGGGSVQDNTSSNQGEVWRVQYTGNNVPTISAQPNSRTASAGGAVTFTVGASGTGLAYQWQRNGSNIAGATSDSYLLSPVALTDNGAKFRVVVTNSAGSVTSNEATLTVNNNRPPTASILTPAAGTLYKAGDVISFSGSGIDPDEATLPAGAFTWRVDFHHADHMHPGPAPTVAGDGRSGSFQIPTDGETASDVWYRLFLTVTDNQGSKSTVYVDINPRRIVLTLASVPSGLQVTVDGQPHTTPYSQTVVSGIQLTLGTSVTQTQGGTTYTLTGWSPALGANGRMAAPDANITYTASFTGSTGGTSTTGIVSGATYSIAAKHSGKVIDVSGISMADGALVHQWDYVGGNNQKWVVTRQSNGYYSMKAVHSGKVLDIKDRSTADGAVVQQMPYTGADNQLFTLVDAGGGYYRIVAKHSQKCLDVSGQATSNGGKLIQWPSHGGDNQKFRFTLLSQPGAREDVTPTVSDAEMKEPSIYPNPATDVLTVAGATGAVVSVIDVVGTIRVTGKSTTAHYGIDVSALSQGLYVIQIDRGTAVYRRRVIIKR